MHANASPPARSLMLVGLSAFVGLLFGLYGSRGAGGGLAFGIGADSLHGDALFDATHSGVATLVETRATSALIVETAVPIVATAPVLAALPERDPLLAAARSHSCAVVGNSAILLGARQGSTIDAHDTVFRMNWPPPNEKYVGDVGERTDVMLVGASTSLHSRFRPYASFHNYSRDITVLYEMREFDQWHTFLENRNESGAPAAQFVVSRHFQTLVDALACESGVTNAAERLMRSGCRASTGLRAVVAAALMCETVDVYGFGTAKGYGHAPYFSEHRRVYRESALFDYHAEKRVLKALASGEPPAVLRRLTLGEVMLHEPGLVHKDSFTKAWTRYPRLTVYNEARDVSSSSFDKREPPLYDVSWPQREAPQRVFAKVNNNKPREMWDYRRHVIQYSNNTYKKGAKLGHGTYGDVYKADEKWHDGREIVLKYLKKQDRRPWILSREIMLLKTLGGRHTCIELLDVVLSPKSDHTILVFPLIHIMPYHSVYYNFEDLHVRYYTYKMFEGLNYAHSQGILHNDIKPLNLLLDTDTRQQYVADWGLGEYYFPPNNTEGPNTTLSFHVGTRHWKAPELLLGAHHYGYAVDVWSAGCTFLGMLFRRTHFFAGVDNQHQIVLIVQQLGTAALDNYVEKNSIPLDREWYNKHIGQWSKKSWASHFTAETSKFYQDGVDELLDQMMMFDPEERATAQEIMDHRYFDPVRDMTEPPEWPWVQQH